MIAVIWELILPRFKIKNHICDVFFSFTLSPAGIVKKAELEHYWATDEMISTPYWGRVMSRNRFQIIWRFLQFKDPDLVVTAAVKADALFKVRWVLDYMQQKFNTLYQPARNIGIDEGMLKWRGRLHFRCYQKVTFFACSYVFLLLRLVLLFSVCIFP